jgi:hypothetical protein
MKTETKTKKKYPCPYCKYSSDWAGAITNHVKGNHPEGWKGSISATLGIPDTPGAKQRRELRQRQERLIRIGGRILKGDRLSKRDKRLKTSATELIQKRKSNFNQRKRFLEMGLTSSGKKRKRGPAAHIVAKYSLNNGVHRHEELPAPVAIDWNGEAARAILVASEIIKDVSIGMQLRANQQ